MIVKLKNLLLLFIILPLLVSAQCKDCSEKDTNWKFATGVTVYSNNHYVSDVNILERQPLEFNLRYKLKERHVLRLSIPILWKVNKHGEPAVSSQAYPTREVTLEDYLQTLHDKDYTYADYYKTLQYSESLYGISAGYDYNLPLGKSISLFAGFNLSYSHLEVASKYYNISYYGLDNENKSKIGLISLMNMNIKTMAYTINPLLGVRYQFQKLLFEGNIGYAFTKADYAIKYDFSSIEGISGIIAKGSNSGKSGPNNFRNLVYNVSVFYTF